MITVVTSCAHEAPLDADGEPRGVFLELAPFACLGPAPNQMSVQRVDLEGATGVVAVVFLVRQNHEVTAEILIEDRPNLDSSDELEQEALEGLYASFWDSAPHHTEQTGATTVSWSTDRGGRAKGMVIGRRSATGLFVSIAPATPDNGRTARELLLLLEPRPCAGR